MFALPWPVEWTLPLLAGIVAPAAGVATAVLARRGLRPGKAGPARLAAAARGVAVTLALLAVAGPERVERETPDGVVAVAAPGEVAAHEGDVNVRWPSDARDAVDALQHLRATRDPARTTALVLETDGRTAPAGAGRPDDGDLRRSVSAFPGIEPALVALPGTPERPTPVTAGARLLAPASAVAGAPIRLTLIAGREPLPAGPVVLEVEGVRVEDEIAAPARRHVLPEVRLAEGVHRAVVRRPELPDRLPAAAFVVVAPPPTALVLARTTAQTLALSERLGEQGVRMLTAGNLSGVAQAIDEAGVFVLGPGVGGGGIGSAVARRVREGAGLLVVGGPPGQDLSRLRGSDLAPLLPVHVPDPPEPPEDPPPDDPPPRDPPDDRQPEVRTDEGEKDALRVALLLVVDRSGSMAGPKMRLAQEAALAAAKTLDPDDRVGVIAFSDRAEWIAPFQNARFQGTLRQSVRGMRAEGGTNFYPALKDGIERILRQQCGIRHIVLLTDGVTRTAVFSDLVMGGAQRGVTLSTVAVGDGADTYLLGLLANWGRGKLYLALDPQRLPAIVTLDSKTFGRDERDRRLAETDRPDVDVPRPPPTDDTPPPRDPDVETPKDPGPPPTPGPRLRTPRIVAPAPALAGLDEATWPRVAHAQAVRTRTGAHVPLEWMAEDDAEASPALVLGRAGMGRVAVFAGDPTSDETDTFAGWDQSGRFLAQLVRALEPPPAPAVATREGRFLATEADREGPAAFLHVPDVGPGEIELAPVDGNGPSMTVRLASAQGGALARLPELPERGVHAGLLRTDNGLVRVLAVSPGPPRIPAGGHHGSVDEVARVTGLAPRSLPPEPSPSPEREERTPASGLFLAGALVFLVIESAARRMART